MSEVQLANEPVAAKTAIDIEESFKDLDNEDSSKTSESEVRESKKESPSEEHSKEDKSESLDDIELKDSEDEPEKLDLKEDDLDIDAPPRKKEILAKYPELFKTFPFLEKILYRDRQYNELFGSFDDAKEIAEKSEAFAEFENQLLAGNTENILKGVRESDSKAFNKIVDNYLPALKRVDSEAYYHVVGNLNKRLIEELVAESKNKGDEDLATAAAIINQFIFGTSKYTPPTKLVEESDGVAEVEKARLNDLRERFESVRDDLQGQVDNTLRATISEYIDQKGVMSPYVKKNAIADAMRIVNENIISDSLTVKNLDKLWRAATEARFSKDTQGKIKSYYLGRAKALLGKAIIKARAEALKDSPKAKTDNFDEETEARPQKRIVANRPAQGQNKNVQRKGESVSDFFMRD